MEAVLARVQVPRARLVHNLQRLHLDEAESKLALALEVAKVATTGGEKTLARDQFLDSLFECAHQTSRTHTPRSPALRSSPAMRVSMRGKLLLLILPALAGTLYFSGSTVLDRYTHLQSTESARALFELVLTADPALENLQKERGLTALFIATGGADGRVVERLEGQRAATDASALPPRDSAHATSAASSA